MGVDGGWRIWQFTWSVRAARKIAKGPWKAIPCCVTDRPVSHVWLREVPRCAAQVPLQTTKQTEGVGKTLGREQEGLGSSVLAECTKQGICQTAVVCVSSITSASRSLKKSLLVSQEARHWAGVEKSGFRMLVMQGVNTDKKGPALVPCPAAPSPLMSSGEQNRDPQQTATPGAGDNQGAPGAWRQDLSSGTDFTCILPLFMAGFCWLIYIKMSQDLACAFPNVYGEPWEVRSLLNDSYSEISASHHPPFGPAMG